MFGYECSDNCRKIYITCLHGLCIFIIIIFCNVATFITRLNMLVGDLRRHSSVWLTHMYAVVGNWNKMFSSKCTVADDHEYQHLSTNV